MDWGGFAGNILNVDLSNNEVQHEPLNQDWARQFIGGLGLTLRIAYDRIKPGVDALSPDNTIVLGAGPLVGTNLPASSRVFAVSKLPTSGTIGWCGAGGVTFGCMFKYAGLDNIVITGRAEKPVYLYVTDEKVELRDASDLWGGTVEEACDALWEKHGSECGVLSIGRAGENQVTFSMAFVNRLSTMGRGGLGAVFGSKNLKAVVVSGSKGLAVADRKRYRKLLKGMMENIRAYPYLKEWQDLGMIKSFPFISREMYDGVKVRRIACVSCPSGCKDLVRIPDGQYAGLLKYTSSAINVFMPLVYGFEDYREAIKLITRLDEHGMDMFEFFGLMEFITNLKKHKVIDPDLVQPDIVMGSLESLETWADNIADRRGLGDVLAGGFNRVIEEFGEECEKYSPALVKGMQPYAGPGSALSWDRFGTMELGQVLDPRGPHVGSGGSPTYFALRPLEVFPKHLTRMGVPEDAIQRIIGQGGPEEALKVGSLLKYSHAWFSTLGSMGICARAQINRFYNAQFCAEAYEAVTGIPTDLPALRRRVDRVWTLYRMANIREGFTRENEESLPEKWFEGDGFKEYLSGRNLEPSESEEMIEDYYREWGWDPKTGVPTPKALEKLGLVNV